MRGIAHRIWLTLVGFLIAQGPGLSQANQQSATLVVGGHSSDDGIAGKIKLGTLWKRFPKGAIMEPGINNRPFPDFQRRFSGLQKSNHESFGFYFANAEMLTDESPRSWTGSPIRATGLSAFTGVPWRGSGVLRER
jgi:hypothetical protein